MARCLDRVYFGLWLNYSYWLISWIHDYSYAENNPRTDPYNIYNRQREKEIMLIYQQDRNYSIRFGFPVRFMVPPVSASQL